MNKLEIHLAAENGSLRDKLATREAQIVMLREALAECIDNWVPDTCIGTYSQALAATDDLDMILCEREPVAFMFQHEETGGMVFVEAQQIERGFEKNNPRLFKIGPLYRARKDTK